MAQCSRGFGISCKGWSGGTGQLTPWEAREQREMPDPTGVLTGRVVLLMLSAVYPSLETQGKAANLRGT